MIRFSSPLVLALLWGGAALADGAPFVDHDFTRRSADNDPDLIVVREQYDPAQRTQAIYLRVFDGTPDHQVVSGQITFHGAAVRDVFVDRDSLERTDAIWGLPGHDYGPAEGRGPDGVDPLHHVPASPDDGEDAVRQPDANTVRFWFGTGSDVDDLRILIRYPRESGPASLDVSLFHRGVTDRLGFPITTQGGIHVGSLVDAVPDDGDYSEVFEVTGIKLRIEDVDLVEDVVWLGSVSPAGGLAGPAFVTVDNDFGGADVDQDNGFDQNGLISPIPASSDLEHLRWALGPLRDGAGHELGVDHVRLVGAPEQLPVGRRAQVSLAVTVPPLTPVGLYRGRVFVWEDNNGNDVRQVGEPQDQVEVRLSVGVIADGGPDAEPPLDALPADAQAPVDAGPADAERDATPLDATPPDVSIHDAGADGGRDASPPADASRRADGGLGEARGGALGCEASGLEGAWPLVVLLVPWIRRRSR
jgi:hypothetical protein